MFHLKPISKAGIPEAIAKVDLYRSLNKRVRPRAAREGLVMDMPWKKIAPVSAKEEYLMLLTYLPLK